MQTLRLHSKNNRCEWSVLKIESGVANINAGLKKMT